MVERVDKVEKVEIFFMPIKATQCNIINKNLRNLREIICEICGN
jgi:hypothetical protein